MSDDDIDTTAAAREYVPTKHEPTLAGALHYLERLNSLYASVVRAEVERLRTELADALEDVDRLVESICRAIGEEDESDPKALAAMLDGAVAGLRTREVAEANAWASEQRAKDLEAERDATLARAERAEYYAAEALRDNGLVVAEALQLRADLAEETARREQAERDLAREVQAHDLEKRERERTWNAKRDALIRLAEEKAKREQAERERDIERRVRVTEHVKRFGGHEHTIAWILFGPDVAAALYPSGGAPPVEAPQPVSLPVDPRPPAPEWLEKRLGEAIAKSRAKRTTVAISKREPTLSTGGRPHLLARIDAMTDEQLVEGARAALLRSVSLPALPLHPNDAAISARLLASSESKRKASIPRVQDPLRDNLPPEHLDALERVMTGGREPKPSTGEAGDQ